MRDERLLVALDYSEHGYLIFPLSKRGIPLVDWRGLEGVEFDRVEHWWEKHPNAGIGVKLGRESQLWTLEIEMPNEVAPRRANGLESLQRLMADNDGTLPQTSISTTPGGGWNVWFEYPYQRRVTCKALGGYPAIRARGNGSFSIFPPSTVKRGEYRWMQDIGEFPPAEAPTWLTDLLTTDETEAKPCQNLE